MKFLKDETHAQLAAVFASVSTILGEEADIDKLIKDDGLTAALTTALTPEPSDEPTEAQSAKAVHAFLEGCEIDLKDQSAEDAIAALSGAKVNFDALAGAISAAGIDIEAITQAEDPAAALQEKLEGKVTAKSVQTVAATGAKTDETPDTTAEDDGDTPKTEADFGNAIAAADKNGDAATASKLYAQMREKFPKKG